MARISSGLIAAAVVVWSAGPAWAKTETIKGELLDEACYLKDKKNAGVPHKECADTCARKGQPLALLTPDGKIYRVTGALAADNNAKLLPHLSHTVEVTGEISEKDGRMTIAADEGSLKMVSR